jgi:hypothetical protein
LPEEKTDRADRFKAFRTGFEIARDTPLLKRLSAHDYWLLLMGREVVDWDELGEVREYRGYGPNAVPVQLFWKLFGEMNEGTKRKMLHFMTGSSRAPIGWIASILLTIVKGADRTRLPTAHSCGRKLALPDVPDKETLRNHEGFGLI